MKNLILTLLFLAPFWCFSQSLKTDSCELSGLKLHWSFSDSLITVGDSDSVNASIDVFSKYNCFSSDVISVTCYETTLGMYEVIYDKIFKRYIAITNSLTKDRQRHYTVIEEKATQPKVVGFDHFGKTTTK